MSLEGKLTDLGLPDIFQILSLSKRSGILTLLRKEGSARLVFKNGNIVFASSDNKSRLGYTLVKKGILTTEELEEALKIQSRSNGTVPLGNLLIDMELISWDRLEEEIRLHICIVVDELLSWHSGAFHFELGELVDPNDQNLPLPDGLGTDFILLESARIKDEEQAGVISSESVNRQLFEDEVLDEAGISASRVPDDMKILTSMIAEIAGPSSSSEITLMVLRFASELMNRAAIFLVRHDDIAGLGQFGIDFEGCDEVESDTEIRNVIVRLDTESMFSRVVEKKESYTGKVEKNDSNSAFVKKLGNQWPFEVFIAPLITDDKVVAVLYGDNLSEKREIGRTEALEAFIRVAGVSLGKALLERRLNEQQNSA